MRLINGKRRKQPIGAGLRLSRLGRNIRLFGRKSPKILPAAQYIPLKPLDIFGTI
jgi:hypothetical protein